MASKATAQELFENRGHVKNVCKEFLVKNDETLAYRLQDQEFYDHYDQNRKQRRVIRTDIPVAKTIQQTEYQQLMKRHEMLEKLEKDDELIAREMQKKYLEEVDKLQKMQQDADEEYAKKLLSEKVSDFDNSNNNIDNARFNKRINESFITENMNRLNLSTTNHLADDEAYLTKIQEQQDYEIARYLQEQEENTSMVNREHKQQSQPVHRHLLQKQGIHLNKTASLYILNQENQKLYCANKTYKKEPQKLVSPRSKAMLNPDSRKSMYEVNQWNNHQTNKNQVFQKLNTETSRTLVVHRKHESMNGNDRSAQTLKDTSSTNEKQFDMTILKVTDNILAAIDPTFRRRYSLKDLNVNKKEKQQSVHTISNSKTLNLKTGYSMTLNTKYADELAPPVQGQRRTKTLNNRKKSSSQCLQQ